jgi:hypothetical protein
MPSYHIRDLVRAAVVVYLELLDRPGAAGITAGIGL